MHRVVKVKRAEYTCTPQRASSSHEATPMKCHMHHDLPPTVSQAIVSRYIYNRLKTQYHLQIFSRQQYNHLEATDELCLIKCTKPLIIGCKSILEGMKENTFSIVDFFFFQKSKILKTGQDEDLPVTNRTNSSERQIYLFEVGAWYIQAPQMQYCA